MKKLRVAKLSARKQIETVMQDRNVWGTPFTVYGEDDLYDNPADAPDRPFVFVLDPFVEFEAKHLPVIVVEVMGESASFELGTLSLRIALNVHIFGRNSGERDDIASAIMENVSAIQIRNYAEDPDGKEVIQTAALVPGNRGQLWETRIVEPQDMEVVEETLKQWVMVSSEFWYT